MALKSSKQGTQDKNENKQDEVDRYRQAAEDALQQLDWTIGYLHGIRKTEISKALAKNRSYIRKKLMDEPDAGVPTQETEET
jgi:ABC-type branched-subunit amino acid transport system ATPase component